MRKDNKGFSLVELIIVIAIIGILGGMFIAGTGYINSSAARSLANSVKTAIGETRIKTMGKQETALYIFKNADDGKYYKQYLVRVNNEWQPPEIPEVIGKHYPIVKFSIDKGSSYTDMVDGGGLMIYFDRKTGKEKQLYINNTFKPDSTGALVSGTGMNMSCIECTNILITGGGAVCNVVIEPATGKVTLE